MGLILLADDAVQFVLLLLLVPVLGLTVWEVRERDFAPKSFRWWITFVGLTHAAGYIILRVYCGYQDRQETTR